jgi:hypothetical protein
VAFARGHRISTFREEAMHLRRLADQEHRLVVAYSHHERALLTVHGGWDASPGYRDARMIAKRWRHILYRQAPLDGHSLQQFLALIEFERGSYLGCTKGLQHNEIDCRGMQALVRRAAEELATSGEPLARNSRR